MVKLSKIWKMDCNVYLRVAAEGKFFVFFFLLVGLVAESFRLWARKATTLVRKLIAKGFAAPRANPFS